MRVNEALPFEVLVAPGCYGGPDQPVVSRHASLDAAVRKAYRSDRLEVQHYSSTRTLYRAPRRDDHRLGAGRYGNGPTRGESLRTAIATAYAAAREVLA